MRTRAAPSRAGAWSSGCKFRAARKAAKRPRSEAKPSEAWAPAADGAGASAARIASHAEARLRSPSRLRGGPRFARLRLAARPLRGLAGCASADFVGLLAMNGAEGL